MDYYYFLEGAIVPKARPRNSRCGHSYLPTNYRVWKNEAIDLLSAQHEGEAIAVPVSISVILTGKHSQRGDADNVIGSILDAIVQAGIIKDDNMKRVVAIDLKLIHSKESPRALIRLETEIDLELPDWVGKCS